MAHPNRSTLLSLPIDILHDIFDHVDVQTILCSIGCVCSQLNTATRSYKRYRLDLRKILMPDFYSVCRRIQPENVILLALSDMLPTPGQIGLFLSIFQIRDFTRLKSLILHHITCDDLKSFLCDLNPYALTTLSVLIDNHGWYGGSTQGSDMLLSIIPQLNLTRLYLNYIDDVDVKRLFMSQTLRYFSVEDCTYEIFCEILSCSPNLQTFVINLNLDLRTFKNRTYSFTRYTGVVFHQLISLIIDRVPHNSDIFSELLALTPSLVNLKIGTKEYSVQPMYEPYLSSSWRFDGSF